QIEQGGKAYLAGLSEGDEVVSINGKPCSDLSWPDAMMILANVEESLQMLIKRSSTVFHDSPDQELESAYFDGAPTTTMPGMRSTTLQIWPSRMAPPPRELYISESQDEAYYGESESDTDLSTGARLRDPKSNSSQGAKCDVGGAMEFQQGEVVELCLSFPEGKHEDVRGAPLRMGHWPLTGVTQGFTVPDSEGAHPGPSFQPVVISRGKIELTGTGDQRSASTLAPQSRVELTLQPILKGRQEERGEEEEEVVVLCRSQSGRRGWVEGGSTEAPPAVTVSFGISSEGEQEEEDEGEEEQEERDSESERDQSRPNKHRARHARLRRSESLSEKQVKEAKSKCKRIALLLTAAPNPNNKGVLMFKKHRQRAKKYTLVSYGTGEEEPEEETEEPEEGYTDNAFEVTFLAASESVLDDEFFAGGQSRIVTLNLDTGLLEIEKNLNDQKEMERLPETRGKGALMFARRRQRVDQITAEQEEMRRKGIPVEDPREIMGAETVQSATYRVQEASYSEKTDYNQSHSSQSYIDVGQKAQVPMQHGQTYGGPNVNGIVGKSEMAQHTAAYQSTELQRSTGTNRTAKPFSGVQNRAAAPFSPIRSVTSPISDVPAQPHYTSQCRVPINTQQVWSPTGAGEDIASRDERISVPAIKTGILQDTRKRNTSKPMFTFKEPPKVSPNPELLNLLNKPDKRIPGCEYGPEEDYLSLGAEACNFLQSSAVKQKTPPPVAPKPNINPASPPWSPPPPEPSTQAPNLPAQDTEPTVIVAPIQPIPPQQAPIVYRQPPPVVNTAVSPSAVPYPSTSAHSYSSKTPPTTPVGNAAPAGGLGPAFEMPALRGRGAELFAKRQSRMEKYVVDSSTVQANQARSSSPTPSLPASWKYSPNVRAPPPLAYNPIQSPSYPPGAAKNQPKSGPSAKTKTKPKGPTKVLHALDVMKHQPYQLNSSLFTYGPPTDSKTPQTKAPSASSMQPMKYEPVPPVKAVGQMNVGYATPQQPPQVPRGPSYGLTPMSTIGHDASFQSAANAMGATTYPQFTKNEQGMGVTLMAPRPKFSAKKTGVTAQGLDRSRSLSLPRRLPSSDFQSISPCTTPVFQPTDGLFQKQRSFIDHGGKAPTPWQAAARSPLGLVDEAFNYQNVQEYVAASVISAAQRKTLPEPPMEWKEKVSYKPRSKGIQQYQQHPLSLKATLSAPPSSASYGPPIKYVFQSQRSKTDSDIQYRASGSDCGVYGKARSDTNYNVYPRVWRQ
ncbi:SYNP2 protein, partial [Polypterus senegalus]|nr:SYNP2 protein [Polypterus senegalus]